MMNAEEVKMLARAGFTAEEIRAMYSEPEKDPAAATPKDEPTEKPTPTSEAKPDPIPEEKNDEVVKILSNKIDELTKALHANAIRSTTMKTPEGVTVEDAINQIINGRGEKK